MDSLTYIRHLQAEYAIKKIGDEQDLANRLVGHLGDRLPELIKHKIDNGTINFAEIQKSDPQAFVKEVAENDFAVVIHSGLSEFVYRVVRAISTRIADQKLGVEAGESFDDTIRIVSEIFWWFQETGQSFGPEYKIDEYQIKIASIIATEVESFFLAHELAHVIVPNEDKLSSQKLIERLAFGDFKGFIQKEDHPHFSEFVSDAIAASIVLGVYNNRVDKNPVLNNLRYVGIEFGLLIFSGLEALGFETSNSHPSFKERIHNVREMTRKWSYDDESWQNLIQIASHLELLFEKIISSINNPTNSQLEYYEESAAEVLRQIEQSLNENSISIEENLKKNDSENFVDVQLENGEIVKMPAPSFNFEDDSITPKYTQFYMEASNILGVGYSHIFFENLAREFRRNIKLSHDQLLELEFKLGLIDKEQRTEILKKNRDLYVQLKEFQKTKLLHGYFSRQANPSGEYFYRKIYGR
ncbi:MAG: hypothetical protein AAFO07_12845 [Bacteroidota bacterium]